MRINAILVLVLASFSPVLSAPIGTELEVVQSRSLQHRDLTSVMPDVVKMLLQSVLKDELQMKMATVVVSMVLSGAAIAADEYFKEVRDKRRRQAQIQDARIYGAQQSNNRNQNEDQRYRKPTTKDLSYDGGSGNDDYDDRRPLTATVAAYRNRKRATLLRNPQSAPPPYEELAPFESGKKPKVKTEALLEEVDAETARKEAASNYEYPAEGHLTEPEEAEWREVLFGLMQLMTHKQQEEVLQGLMGLGEMGKLSRLEETKLVYAAQAGVEASREAAAAA